MKTVSILSQASTIQAHFTKQLFSILALLVFLLSFVTTPAFAASIDNNCSSISDPQQQMICLYDRDGDGKVNEAELNAIVPTGNTLNKGALRAASCGPKDYREMLEGCEGFGGSCRKDDGCPGCKAGVTLNCATFGGCCNYP